LGIVILPITMSILDKIVVASGEISWEQIPLPGLPLVGKRLKIRLFHPEDEEKRQAWAKFVDPYQTKYNFPPRNPGANLAVYHRLRDRIRLAVVDELNDLAGYISLKAVLGDPNAAELGICFAADRVGKGYGEEAMRLVLEWAEHSVGLNKVLLEVDQVNLRAIRLYQRLGFVKLTEFWKAEDNPILRRHIQQTGVTPGIRITRNRLEVFSWVMQWEKTEP
jgi:RimJ/RimL family protein N-acetyltransferase